MTGYGLLVADASRCASPPRLSPAPPAHAICVESRSAFRFRGRRGSARAAATECRSCLLDTLMPLREATFGDAAIGDFLAAGARHHALRRDTVACATARRCRAAAAAGFMSRATYACCYCYVGHASGYHGNLKSCCCFVDWLHDVLSPSVARATTSWPQLGITEQYTISSRK